MNFDRGDVASTEKPGGPCSNSILKSYEAQIRSRHFGSSRQRLLSVLELSQSYQTFLQGEKSLARFFHVPLMSDTLAEKVVRLFSELYPRVLEVDNESCDKCIHWVDIVCDQTYESKRQDDGKYHCRLQNCKAWIEISEFDYNLILSGILQQFVHPFSHMSDVRAEIETMRLATTEILSWNKIALECGYAFNVVDIVRPLSRAWLSFVHWDRFLAYRNWRRKQFLPANRRLLYLPDLTVL